MRSGYKPMQWGLCSACFLTLHHSWFCAPPNKSKAEYLSYLLLQPPRPTHRGSINPHFKLWFLKTTLVPSSKDDGPLYFQRRKVMNPWPTSGPNCRQSQRPSLKLTEHQNLEHTPKNNKDPGSNKWKQKYKNRYLFVSWLKEWRGVCVGRGNRHPNPAQSSTSTSTENPANRASDALFPVILVLRKLWNAINSVLSKHLLTPKSDVNDLSSLNKTDTKSKTTTTKNEWYLLSSRKLTCPDVKSH